MFYCNLGSCMYITSKFIENLLTYGFEQDLFQNFFYDLYIYIIP